MGTKSDKSLLNRAVTKAFMTPGSALLIFGTLILVVGRRIVGIMPFVGGPFSFLAWVVGVLAIAGGAWLIFRNVRGPSDS